MQYELCQITTTNYTPHYGHYGPYLMILGRYINITCLPLKKNFSVWVDLDVVVRVVKSPSIWWGIYSRLWIKNPFTVVQDAIWFQMVLSLFIQLMKFSTYGTIFDQWTSQGRKHGTHFESWGECFMAQLCMLPPQFVWVANMEHILNHGGSVSRHSSICYLPNLFE